MVYEVEEMDKGVVGGHPPQTGGIGGPPPIAFLPTDLLEVPYGSTSLQVEKEG